MDDIKFFTPLRERKQKVLGLYSFTEPINPKSKQGTAATSRSREPQAHAQARAEAKRDKSLQAQRRHRQNTREYIIALEAEVESLRNGETRLTQISTDWKRATVALIGPSREAPFHDKWIGRMGPGIFLWTMTGNRMSDRDFSSKQLLLLLLSPEAAFRVSALAFPPSIEIYDATVQELLLNFCENIIPTLDVTQAISHGYAKHIVPLAIESDMVRNALLAASASQMRSQKSMRYKSLIYRSVALSGLQQTAKELQEHSTYVLYTLATILGLLIDDMINENKEFPALVKMADSCIALHPLGNDQSHAPLLQFLQDQIQMIKALAHPLYKFSQGYNPSTRSFGSTDLPLLPSSHSKMSNIFANMESATTQACSIYNLRPPPNTPDNIPRTSISLSELDTILDTLKSTVSNIPPFAPGENSLVWVYSVAVSRSTRHEHCAFFTSRLAELLRRVGHQDISGYLSSLSVH